MRLTVILSERVLEERDFKGSRRVRVGREAEVDLRLDNPAISRVHCEFEDLGGGAWVVTDRSGGRTYVNGAKIERHDLVDGDLIALGKFTLAVTLTQIWTSSPQTRGVPGGATIQGVAERGRETSLTRPLGYVCEGAGASYPLEALHTSVGRGKSCQIRLAGRAHPRVAAVFVREENLYRVTDVSPQGDSLSVRGQACRGADLSEGDSIVVCGRSFEFHYGSPDDPEPEQ